MLGAEGPGLSDAAMRSATHRVRIPISGDVDSLNVGHAARSRSPRSTADEVDVLECEDSSDQLSAVVRIPIGGDVDPLEFGLARRLRWPGLPR